MPKQPMKKIKVTTVKPKISPTLFRLGRWLQCHFQEKHQHYLKTLEKLQVTFLFQPPFSGFVTVSIWTLEFV